MNSKALSPYIRKLLIRHSGMEAQRRQRDKIRQTAAAAVHKAVRNGRLPKASELKCTCCPAQAVEYHHHNGYDKAHWLDVIPLCIKCHRRLEKKDYKCCQGVKESGERCTAKVHPDNGGYCYRHLLQKFTPLEVELAKKVVVLEQQAVTERQRSAR
jgi:hypothetical protein